MCCRLDFRAGRETRTEVHSLLGAPAHSSEQEGCACGPGLVGGCVLPHVLRFGDQISLVFGRCLSVIRQRARRALRLLSLEHSLCLS